MKMLIKQLLLFNGGRSPLMLVEKLANTTATATNATSTFYRSLHTETTKNNVAGSSTSGSSDRIRNVMVIGAGIMGTGIAQTCAMSGRMESITLSNFDTNQLERAQNNMRDSLRKFAEKGRLKNQSVDEVLSRITFNTKMEPVEEQNLIIIEAIVEQLTAKQELFIQLYKQFASNPTVLYASNTSSLLCRDIVAMVKDLQFRHRFAATHFIDPLLSPLVEVATVNESHGDLDTATTTTTQAQTIERVCNFITDIDKQSIICKDMKGFIVNRMLLPYIREALQLVDNDIASISDIDIAMRLGANHSIGPFELMDRIGLDTIKFVTESWHANNDNGGEAQQLVIQSRVLNKLVSEGNLGRKTGKGFYDYTIGGGDVGNRPKVARNVWE